VQSVRKSKERGGKKVSNLVAKGKGGIQRRRWVGKGRGGKLAVRDIDKRTAKEKGKKKGKKKISLLGEKRFAYGSLRLGRDTRKKKKLVLTSEPWTPSIKKGGKKGKEKGDYILSLGLHSEEKIEEARRQHVECHGEGGTEGGKIFYNTLSL